MAALHYIRRDPVLLFVFRRSGHDPTFQRFMDERAVGSIATAFSIAITPPGSRPVAWRDIVATVHSGLPEPVVTATFAAISDVAHGFGNPGPIVRFLSRRYGAIASRDGFDAGNPNADGTQ